MAKDILTQWKDAIWGAERPLFVLPRSVDTDMFAAACALGHALQQTGRTVTLLCPRTMSTHAEFLTGPLVVKRSLEEIRTYTCTLPSALVVSRVTHELLPTGGGSITLHLEHPLPSPALPQLHFSTTLPPFDRLIVFGAQDLSEVAPLFGDAHALLAQTPLATLSWQPATEPFGRWNIVYEQSTTLSEVVAGLLRDLSPESLKDHVATCALAGIIAKTKHFRSELVTPSLLNMCADLVAAGADRLKIIEELYRTRSVDTLRLWGAACSRLQEIVPGILSSEITGEDFLRTHTTSEALQDIAQEVLQSSEKTHEVLFFYRERDVLHARVVAKRPFDARTFIGALRTEGTRESAVHIFEKETSSRHIIEQLRKAAS